MDKDMFLIHQAPNKPLLSYLLKFKGAVDVVESSEGSPWSHPAATKIVFDKIFDPKDHAAAKMNNSTDYKTAAIEAQHRYLAALFFHRPSNNMHKELKKKISNDALTGSDTIPQTYDKVLQLTDQFKPSYVRGTPGGTGGGGGLAFTQRGKTATATAAAAAAMAAKAPAKRKPLPVPGKKD